MLIGWVFLIFSFYFYKVTSDGNIYILGKPWFTMTKIIKVSDKLMMFIESKRKYAKESYSNILERELEFDNIFIDMLKKHNSNRKDITDEDEKLRLKNRINIIKKQFNNNKFECLRCGGTWEKKKDDYYIFCKHCKKRNWFVPENYECEICNMVTWNPEIHHINKDRNNNNPENLLAICLRCHKRLHGQKIRNFHNLNLEVKKRIKYYIDKLEQ